AGTMSATTFSLTEGTSTVKLRYPALTEGATSTVTLSGEGTPATNARKCCIGGTCSVITPTNVCTTTFNTAGFIFSKTTTGGVDTPVTQVAGKPSAVPNANMTYLRAVRTNTSTGACMARLTSSQTVKMAYKCVNPSTCVTGQTFNINSTVIPGNANSVATNSIVYSDVTLNFDANGSAPIPINYSDVGQMQLFASLVLGATSTDPAYTLTGSSNLFVVKPHQMRVSGVTTIGNAPNPQKTTEVGAANDFVSAGTPFRVTVQSTNFGGAITPNFGRETSTQSQYITLATNSLVYPAGGTTTALTYTANAFSSVSSGTYANSTVVWPQVGSMTIMPGLGDYLSAGSVTGTASVTIGRFYPDRFRVVPASTSAGYVCGNFSYMGQSNLQITPYIVAESAGVNPVVLTNYDNFLLGYGGGAALATPIFAAENNENAINLISRLSTTVGKWHAGVYDDPVAGTFARQTSGAPDGPYSSLRVGVSAMSDTSATPFDLVGITVNTPATAAKDMLGATAIAFKNPASPMSYLLDVRYGRLRLDDAFGPETFALPVNFSTEYWAGNRFRLNADDSCTQVPRSAITYPAGAISVNSNRTVALAGGSTQGTYANITATHVGFNAGVAGQQFTSPAGGTGTFVVGVNLATMPWLRFDWNQDGNFSDLLLPNATFTFGSYRGNDRIIYWREKLQ
ncbi:MAG: DUF6701 domain-containing protein, partial [Cellvibrio sp.]